MIVSQYGFEDPAKSFADENDITILTYDQLVSELIDFSSYMNKLIDDYDQYGVILQTVTNCAFSKV
jgi:hypothetical protein